MKSEHQSTPVVAETLERRAAAPGKKLYEKPQIVYRAPLEAMAAVCLAPTGKALGDGLCTVQFS